MAQLSLVNLDFDSIKTDIKNYLSSQSEFSDYDFEGSALNILIETLAYSTHQNAMLAHMMANESFLDTAVKRNSVVSIAKSLGYTPRSRRASTATINFVVTPDPSYSETTLTLSRDYAFICSIANVGVFNFYPDKDYSSTLESRNGLTAFYFDNIPIKQGVRVANRFIVDSNNLSGPFIIPNANVDTSTLRVRVQESGSVNTTVTWKLSETILDITSTSKVYFLEENGEGLYTVGFGDNVVGQKLQSGNIVIIDYITCDGEKTNGGKTFSSSVVITGNQESKNITTVSNSRGGQFRESIESIKQNAPRFRSSANRAVTVSDYQTLIMNSNTSIKSCTVWGGENNNPPIYGKVFISLQPTAGSVITQDIKDEILANVILPKAPVAILPEFVDPEYIYVTLNVNATFDSTLTNRTKGQIETAIATEVQDYFNNELNVLNKDFYYTKLLNYIQDVDVAINSVTIHPKLQKRFNLDLTKDSHNLSFSYGNKLQPREIYSTWFSTATISKCRLIDIPNEDVLEPNYEGSGKLYLQKEDKTKTLIGTVNYTTGDITLLDVKVRGYFGGDTVLRITAGLNKEVDDVYTSSLQNATVLSSLGAVFPAPSKNIILTLNDTVENVLSGARKGLNITATSRIGR